MGLFGNVFKKIVKGVKSSGTIGRVIKGAKALGSRAVKGLKAVATKIRSKFQNPFGRKTARGFTEGDPINFVDKNPVRDFVGNSKLLRGASRGAKKARLTKIASDRAMGKRIGLLTDLQL